MEYKYLKEKFENLISEIESRPKVKISQTMDEIIEFIEKENYIMDYAVRGFVNAHTFVIAISVVTKEETLFLEIYEISGTKIEN